MRIVTEPDGVSVSLVGEPPGLTRRGHLTATPGLPGLGIEGFRSVRELLETIVYAPDAEGNYAACAIALLALDERIPPEVAQRLVLPVLLKMIEEEADPSYRACAVGLLHFCGQSARPALLGLVWDPDGEVQSVAANGLSEIGPLAGEDHMREALATGMVSHPDREVRRRLLNLFFGIRELPRSPAAILRRIEHDDDEP